MHAFRKYATGESHPTVVCPSTILLTAMTSNNVQLFVFVMATVAEMAARWNVSFSSFDQMRFTEQDANVCERGIEEQSFISPETYLR